MSMDGITVFVLILMAAVVIESVGEWLSQRRRRKFRESWDEAIRQSCSEWDE